MTDFGGLGEPTQIEMADDAAHVVTFEAAISLLNSRYSGHQERWNAALVEARLDFARSRARPSPKIVLG